jgi:hypothetical protein
MSGSFRFEVQRVLRVSLRTGAAGEAWPGLREERGSERSRRVGVMVPA